MTKNYLLNAGIIICKLIRWFYVLILIILTGLFVHFQISPSTYKDVDFTLNSDRTGISLRTVNTYKIHEDGKVPEDSEVFAIDELTMGSLYFNYLKVALVMLLGFLCVKEFQKVIESVKGIKTFQRRNVSSFRRIGQYLVVIFFLMSYSSFTFQQGGMSGFYLSFELLILSLLAFIMAEIFKEGNNLLEENELTV